MRLWTEEQAYIRFRQMGLSKYLDEYKEKKHEFAHLVAKVRENPKRFYIYMKNKGWFRREWVLLKISMAVYALSHRRRIDIK